MRLDHYFIFTVITGILSKCLNSNIGNISIQNRDSSVSKKIKLWQNIKFELIEKIWKPCILMTYTEYLYEYERFCLTLHLYLF